MTPIIRAFETEARMLFGVIFMDKIMALVESHKLDFVHVRDSMWSKDVPPELQRGFFTMAKDISGWNLPPQPAFDGFISE